VIGGQRRTKAARSIASFDDFVLVPVVDMESDPVDLTPEIASKYLLSELRIAGTRAGLSSYELSESAERLRSAKDPDSIPRREYTLAKIALAIGRSESWVSKILAARRRATPTLLASWQRGDVTDEQFKDFALARDQAAQASAVEKAVGIRRGGDKAGSRAVAKEQREIARSNAGNADSKATPVHTPTPDAKPAKPAKPERRPPSYAIIEDLLETAAKRPPTHDLVKGIVWGVRWASGGMDAADLPRQWHAYMSLLAGKPKQEGVAKGKAGKAGKASKRKS
jgi:hypothetical protein